MTAKEMANKIAHQLICGHDQDESILYEKINDYCELEISNFREEVIEEVIAILEGHNYGISY